MTSIFIVHFIFMQFHCEFMMPCMISLPHLRTPCYIKISTVIGISCTNAKMFYELTLSLKWILVQVWYLIVSIPDLYTLTYFVCIRIVGVFSFLCHVPQYLYCTFCIPSNLEFRF